MRFHKSFAAFLAASISISGCSPFQRDERPTVGSFRTAPTADLMAMAERYERQGDHAHAARLYEELLKGDPGRAQVRSRLLALSAYGVVSPQAQGALAENIDEIVAEHQRQLAEVESQREIDRQLASMTPISTPDGYQLVDTAVASQLRQPSSIARAAETPTSRGVAQVSIPAPAETWTQETFEVAAADQQAAIADFKSAPAYEEWLPTPPSPQATGGRLVESATETFDVAPSTAAALSSEEWSTTVIRPQDQTRRPGDDAPSTETDVASNDNRAPISRVVSSGSKLWHAVNEPTNIVSPAPTNEAETDSESISNNESEWATPAASSAASTEFASLQSTRVESPWRASTTRFTAEPATTDPADPFCNPIVSADSEFAVPATDEADSADPIPLGAWIDTTQPLQRARSAFTLWQVSGNAERTVPALAELLEHDDSQVVEVACYLLGELGPAADLAAAPLRTLRDSSNETTSILAAEALAKIAPSECESIEHIVHASQSADNDSRLLAAITLAGVDHQHEAKVVPALACLLDDENPAVRSAAALSLGGWGSSAAACSSKLEELALGDVPEVSEAARIALECIEQ